MNPFENGIDPEHLYNITTGKSALHKTEEFLLSIVETGEEKRKEFVNECVADPSRFEKRIRQQTLNTFASEAGKREIKGRDGKIVAACLVRDVFGNILYHSLQNIIDMAEVLKYPLTPVPLSLSHVDGTMQKTSKASLMQYLDSQV